MSVYIKKTMHNFALHINNKERHDLSSVLIISVPCKTICILAPLKVIFSSFCHESNNKIDDDQMAKEGTEANSCLSIY